MPGTAHITLFISSVFITVSVLACGQAQPPDKEALETIEAGLKTPRPENPQEDSSPAPSVSATPTNTPIPPPTTETPDLQATIAAAVEVTLTALPPPTPSPTATLMPPPATLEPTTPPTQEPTPTPTATREYLGEEELAEIVPGVTLWLRPSYGNPSYIGCFVASYPGSNFSLVLIVSNKSDQQFNLRFEKHGVHVIDNVGREYSVTGAGFGECPSEPGLRSRLIDPGEETDIFVSAEGSIGLDVKYLQLTVDNISGYGPFVFRKNP
jgi:hypothetical protein